MQQISTNKLASRKHVEIDGHYYIVRRMGAGDQFTISQYMRELEALAKKEKTTSLTEEDNDKLARIERATLEISTRCFDDRGDGSKSRELVESLTHDELSEIMNKLFNEQPEVS